MTRGGERKAKPPEVGPAGGLWSPCFPDGKRTSPKYISARQFFDQQKPGDIEVLSETLRRVRTLQTAGALAQLKIRSEMLTIARQASPALCPRQVCQPAFPV